MNFYRYVLDNPVDFADSLGLCWIYQQSTGNLYYNPDVSLPSGPSIFPEDLLTEFSIYGPNSAYMGQGYSGIGAGLNNPALADVPYLGPIPQGFWNIGKMEPKGPPPTGINVLPLTPAPGTNILGRNPNTFFVHGDNPAKNNTGSEGCIVMPPGIRKKIGRSPDKCLVVVP